MRHAEARHASPWAHLGTHWYDHDYRLGVGRGPRGPNQQQALSPEPPPLAAASLCVEVARVPRQTSSLEPRHDHTPGYPRPRAGASPAATT